MPTSSSTTSSRAAPRKLGRNASDVELDQHGSPLSPASKPDHLATAEGPAPRHSCLAKLVRAARSTPIIAWAGRREPRGRQPETVARRRVIADACPTDLVHVDADEHGGGLGHVAQRVEGRFRSSCVPFGVEEPERVLNEIAGIVRTSRTSSRPKISTLPCNMATPWSSIICIMRVRASWPTLILYPSDDRVHESLLRQARFAALGSLLHRGPPCTRRGAPAEETPSAATPPRPRKTVVRAHLRDPLKLGDQSCP